MSHVVNIAVIIRDLGSLIAACKRLGFQFIEGSKTYQWFGLFMNDYPLPEGVTVDMLGKCDHEIKVPGASYSIGVVREGNAYKLRWDFWEDGGLLEALGGQNAPKLVQAYAAEHTKKSLLKQGYRVLGETVDAKGNIKVRVEGR